MPPSLPQPELRHGSRPGVEAQEIWRAVADLRYGQRHDRAGLYAGEPDADGSDGGAAGTPVRRPENAVED